MRSQHNIAFKEWAIVCRAIAAGQQTIILRKGGISEKRGGFEVEHREFFLFPTLFHQQNDAVLPAARAELVKLAREFYPESQGGGVGTSEFQLGDTIRLSLYAVVEQTERLTDWKKVHALAPFHIWTEEIIKERFGWGKENAITLIIARFYKLSAPITIPLRKDYGGCTSWVALEKEISTTGAQPILYDAEFMKTLKQVRAAAS